MRRIISILLAFVVCIGVATVCASAENAALLGDVNGDGNVDNLDAATLLKYDAGIIDLGDGALAISDVNYDGAVDNIEPLRYLSMTQA